MQTYMVQIIVMLVDHMLSNRLLFNIKVQSYPNYILWKIEASPRGILQVRENLSLELRQASTTMTDLLGPALVILLAQV